MIKKTLTLIVFMFSVSVFSQNFTDDNGLKQGKWEVKFDDGKTKYIGIFKDGVEQGLFKFYYNSGEIKATKEFFHKGKAAATHIFYKNGNIRASGLYVNKLKDSTWNYYNNDSILVLSEQFQSGDFHGTRKNFYETGEIYIITQWENGVKNGKYYRYYNNSKYYL